MQIQWRKGKKKDLVILWHVVFLFTRYLQPKQNKFLFPLSRLFYYFLSKFSTWSLLYLILAGHHPCLNTHLGFLILFLFLLCLTYQYIRVRVFGKTICTFTVMCLKKSPSFVAYAPVLKKLMFLPYVHITEQLTIVACLCAPILHVIGVCLTITSILWTLACIPPIAATSYKFHDINDQQHVI